MVMNTRDMKKRSNIRENQSGFASVVIALVLIVVLALLTVAFAQLARREQQNALNKQLSNQAYYAAESGINDAYKTVQNWSKTNTFPSPLPDKDTCLGTGVNSTISLGTSNVIDATTGVSYSCVLLDLNPPNISFNSVNSDSDRTANFGTTGAINSLTIYWGSADNQNTPRPANNTDFLTLAQWTAGKYPPVLEVQFTAINSATFTRQDLKNNTFSLFLYPSSGGGSVNFTPGNIPIVAAGDCTVPASGNSYPCKVTINQINGSANSKYLIHIVNHYDQANISIANATAGNGGNGAKSNFTGRAIIDVTGKARNVLKRLQVSVPLEASAEMPPGALTGQSICKRLVIEPGAGSYDNPYGAGSTACTLTTN